MKTFHPFDPGYLIPLAPGQAAGVILGRQLRGRIPYALHYAMCALRSWGWKNRLGVLGELLARRRGRGADAGGLGRST